MVCLHPSISALASFTSRCYGDRAQTWLDISSVTSRDCKYNLHSIMPSSKLWCITHQLVANGISAGHNAPVVLGTVGPCSGPGDGISECDMGSVLNDIWHVFDFLAKLGMFGE